MPAGEATGMLIDNAMALVERLVRCRPRRKRSGPKEVGARSCDEVGWTQLQMAGNTFQEVEEPCRRYAAGKIQLRLYDAIYGMSGRSLPFPPQSAIGSGEFERRVCMGAAARLGCDSCGRERCELASGAARVAREPQKCFLWRELTRLSGSRIEAASRSGSWQTSL
jgi:hypothetical protein